MPSSSKLGVQAKKVLFQRTYKQKSMRSKKEKFERECKMKLGKQNPWLIKLSPTAEKAEKAFKRLQRQQEAGLQPVEGRVLGLGSSPDDCVAGLLESCCRQGLESMKSEMLFERLCELTCLGDEINKHILILMDIMIQRGDLAVSQEDPPMCTECCAKKDFSDKMEVKKELVGDEVKEELFSDDETTVKEFCDTGKVWVDLGLH